MSGPGHLPQVSLLGLCPRDRCSDLPAQERLALHGALLVLALARPVGFMLPEGNRHCHPVPSSDRTPDTRVGIGDVDPADVPGVIAQIEGFQPVTASDERPEPVFEVVDCEQADALGRDAARCAGEKVEQNMVRIIDRPVYRWTSPLPFEARHGQLARVLGLVVIDDCQGDSAFKGREGQTCPLIG